MRKEKPKIFVCNFLSALSTYHTQKTRTRYYVTICCHNNPERAFAIVDLCNCCYRCHCIMINFVPSHLFSFILLHAPADTESCRVNGKGQDRRFRAERCDHCTALLHTSLYGVMTTSILCSNFRRLTHEMDPNTRKTLLHRKMSRKAQSSHAASFSMATESGFPRGKAAGA
jgi:hypothetical protein